SACSQQQYGVPYAPASDSTRTWRYQLALDVTDPPRQSTKFSCHGVSPDHDDSTDTLHGHSARSRASSRRLGQGPSLPKLLAEHAILRLEVLDHLALAAG